MSNTESDKPDSIARVLRAAGERARPSEEMKNAVRAAVHAEWRASIARRRQRRVVLAASVAVAALGLWAGRSYFARPPDLVASVSRSIGTVHSSSGSLATAAEVRAGQSVSTGADGRVALQLRDGVSLRLDHDSRIALVDASRIDVLAGAVYVDAGVEPSASDHLRVGTPAGVVRHAGTQYEARIVREGTRIRVREGRVDLLPDSGTVQSASVGESLLVTRSGAIQRDAIAPSDPHWEWASNTAPEFDINGRPVREFLVWVGRELGRELVFASPESEAEAARAVLSGSVSGLTPSEALDAVLPTTQLRRLDRDGKLEIALSSGP